MKLDDCVKLHLEGEGTNESIDLDKFDQYYHHLFLWDDDAKKLQEHIRMG
jgi:hypothetical protein